MYLVLLYIAYHSFFVVRSRFGHAVRGFLRVHIDFFRVLLWGIPQSRLGQYGFP